MSLDLTAMTRRHQHARRRQLDPMAVGLTAAIILGGMAGIGASMRDVDRPAHSGRALAPPPAIAERVARRAGDVGKPPSPTTAPPVVSIRLSSPTITTSSGDTVPTPVSVRPDVPPDVPPSTVPTSTTTAPTTVPAASSSTAPPSTVPDVTVPTADNSAFVNPQPTDGQP